MKRLALAVLCAAFATGALAQTKWDLPSGYGPNTFQVQNLQWFADEVDKATAGKLKITLHPGASLFKANEIKRAVQTGQTQIGEFILSGAANENGLFGVDSIPFLATTYPEAKKLDDASRPALDKLLASQGMKLLYTVPWPGQSLYSKKPLTSVADSKLYEQVKYFYDVNAWLPRNAVVVSLKAFDALDKATQAGVLKVGLAAGERGWKISDQKDDEYLKELVAKGMTVDRSSAKLKAELKAVGERMTAEWLKQTGADGQAVIDAYRK